MKNIELTIQNVNNQITMTSREFAEKSGKKHDNVLKDIKKAGTALDNASITNHVFFNAVGYVDLKGEKRPEYLMTKQGVLLMAAMYDIAVNAKLILYIATLEQKVLDQQKQLLELKQKEFDREREHKMIVEEMYRRDTERFRSVCDRLDAQEKTRKKKTTVSQRVFGF